MHKVISWSKSATGWIVYGTIMMTLIMPWLFKLVNAHIVTRVGVLFLILDTIWAFVIGRLIRHYHLHWWWSLLLPVLFGIMVWFRFAKYDYWFVAIYWVVTMLATGSSRD